jgi:hypothetical protein
MDKFGRSGSKNGIEIDMFVRIRQPLLSSHDMGDAHLPVIDHIGKMESGPSIRSNYHEIIQGLELKIPEYLIFKCFWKGDEVRLDANCVLLLGHYSFFDLFESEASAPSIISIRLLLLLVFFLFLLAEARVCHIAL